MAKDRLKIVGEGRGEELLVHDVHSAAVADGEEESFAKDRASIGRLVREDVLLRSLLLTPLQIASFELSPI